MSDAQSPERLTPPNLTAAESVQISLRNKITEGVLTPGTRLVDAAVADEYGVSRNTVRDALRLLHNEGLLHSVRNAGYSVRSLSATDVRDIYAARRVIEIGAVERSASASDEQLSAVDAAASATERFLRDGDWAKVGTASLGFHRAIVKLAGSPRLNGFFATTAAQLRLTFAVIPDERKFQIQWVARDRVIADLIVSGARRQAAQALDAYLTDSESQIIDGLRAAEFARETHERHERTA